MRLASTLFIIEYAPSYEDALRIIECAGRTCYKSEKPTTLKEKEDFVARLIARGHESVLEHVSVTGRLITDRGISHELVRHRIASYSQESTRYVNYAQERHGKEIAVICPKEIAKNPAWFDIWRSAIQWSERSYMLLIEAGCTPQIARSVLPTSTKTEIVCTMNIREWRHMLKLRLSDDAHPDMRLVASMIARQLSERYPVLFADIGGNR